MDGRRPTAIVTGMIATYPVGGVLWDYGQYALGLERLGWDVYYLEDTGSQTYDPSRREYVDDPSYGLAFLRSSVAGLSASLNRRWHFRAMDGTTHGMPLGDFLDVARRADLFLNVSGSALLRDDYMPAACKVLIDTDPGWNQFVNYPRWDSGPGWQGTRGFRAHDAFFSYAECYGRPDCALPSLGLPWKCTRPPVVSDCWMPEPPGDRWTTVMTWDNFRRPIEYDGKQYGTKEMEFPKIAQLPGQIDVPIEVAVGGAPPVNRWRAAGWHVVDSHEVSRTPEAYRRYVASSRGEISVAKNIYVAARTGWFSCRSACYLAAGRPVILQDTGFADVLPTGEGLLTFTTGAEALRALRAVEGEYAAHAAAARRFAHEWLDYRVVLPQMLADAGFDMAPVGAVVTS
jgi:hypothetical protein